MQTLIKTLLAIATVSILTGCAGSQPLAPKITKKDDGIMLIQAKSPVVDRDDLTTRQEIHLRYKNDLKLTLKEASKATLQSGNTHFVIINKGTNHLKGFPLSTYEDLSKYCFASYETDEELKSKCGFFMGYSKIRTQMKIIPLTNPSYMFASIDAKSILEEIK